ncbi:GGDEF domain-containing protein [Chryseomicrobium aureum]|uniref:GGDEF domain-containing protein n=1 Tax=Chryseomicrobium aureum TaxID=1441723 RepID=UPI00195B0999|nr:diguanylate cyclase [Chryseomicrobium aureum]MBM7706667.1 GGDEF domain-containing protein [Chryseomicrobium aureum]
MEAGQLTVYIVVYLLPAATLFVLSMLILGFSSFGSIFPAPHFSARLGGDEFVVLLEGITRKSQLDESVGFIKSQGKNFTVQLGEQHVPVEFSVGGAYRENGDTIDELLMRADEQMYKEKYKDRPHERNSFN